MDETLIKVLAEAGPIGLAIIVVFLFYRADSLKRDKLWEEHCKEQIALWKSVADDKRGLIVADQQTREAHIKALHTLTLSNEELTRYLKTMNGKLTDIAAWEGVKYGRRHDDKPVYLPAPENGEEAHERTR